LSRKFTRKELLCTCVRACVFSLYYRKQTEVRPGLFCITQYILNIKLSNHRDYSSIANCRTKIPAIFLMTFGIFRGTLVAKHWSKVTIPPVTNRWRQFRFATSPCLNAWTYSLHTSTRLQAQRYTWPHEFLLRLPDVDFVCSEVPPISCELVRIHETIL
jgi:hypothetical protein